MFKNRKITVGLFVTALLITVGIIVNKYLIAPEIHLHDIEAVNMDGQPLHPKDLKGKVVVLNFWATWCPPCVQEMPMFDNMNKMYGEDKVVFVLATEETGEEVPNFIEKYKLTVPIYQLKEPLKNYGIYTIPATFVFDKKGRLVEKKLGAFNTAEELRMLLQPYL